MNWVLFIEEEGGRGWMDGEETEVSDNTGERSDDEDS